MRQKPALTATDVQKMAAACKAEATKNNWSMSIAIVDEGGYLLYLERMDGAGPLTSKIAAGKAESAAISRRPTKFWEDRIKERPGFAKAPVSTPMQGGVPIMVQKDCVGAIGVSGAQSQEDEQVANVGVAALGA
jgi:glc operon protein GlcG